MQLDVLRGASDTRPRARKVRFCGRRTRQMLGYTRVTSDKMDELKGMVEEEITGETRRRFLMTLAVE